MEDTQLASRVFDRTFALEDIAIRAGGDGRTVTAYAAVFDTPAEIRDQDGHYLETISRSAFDRTINSLQGRSVPVLYNHGKTLYGTPSERGSIPIGRSEEIRADARGVFTVSRYNGSQLANDVLDSIRNGDITGQSFSGKWLQSQRQRSRAGGLDTIVRSEVKLTEYGPTPIPFYAEAAILGVRMEELVDTLRSLTEEDRDRLFTLLDTSRAASSSTATEPVPQGTSGADDNPAERHLSVPNKTERLARVAAIKGILK